MDEKRAFEAMMAEVEDSDSDQETNRRKGKTTSSSHAAGSKTSSSSRFETNGGTKQTNSQKTLDQVSNRNSGNMAQPKDSSRLSTSGDMAFSKLDHDIMNFGEEQKKFGMKNESNGRENSATTSTVSKNFLMRPCAPNEPPMLCFVERDRPTFGALSGGTVYRVYLEVGNDSRRAKFLMSAKKILNKRTSYYLVSTEMEPNDDRGGDDVLGKVRANAVGSRYLLTDHGIAPDKTQAPSMLRKVTNF